MVLNKKIYSIKNIFFIVEEKYDNFILISKFIVYMPTKRKFRRNKNNNRKSRRRRGGVDWEYLKKATKATKEAAAKTAKKAMFWRGCTTLGAVSLGGISEKCSLCLGYRESYNDAVEFVRNVNDIPPDQWIKLDEKMIADYYWNKALTQFREDDVFDEEKYLKNEDGFKGNKEKYKLHTGTDKAVLSRGSAAANHIKGKKMEAIVLSIMKDFVKKYNNKIKSLFEDHQIIKVTSLKKRDKTPWSNFIIENFDNQGENYEYNSDWEGQNCFLTAGDTRKLWSAEQQLMRRKADKQTGAGYIIGKILGDIGHAVGAELMKNIKEEKEEGYGLESMSGLRHSAILLVLLGLFPDSGDENKQIEALYKLHNNNKKLNFIKKNVLKKDFECDLGMINKARTLFKKIIEDEAIKPKYMLNSRNIKDIIVACNNKDNYTNTGIELGNPQEQGTGNQTGGKRRRRKRRTKRGGKSRRRKRRTKRSRRRKIR